MNLIDSFIRDDSIIPPDELIDHLVVRTGKSHAQCRIFLIVYFQTIRLWLKAKETAVSVKGFRIRPSVREPYRITAK